MIVNVKGEVFRSRQEEGKKMFSTTISQTDDDLLPVKISTRKQYKPGDRVDVLARVSVSMFNNKVYLICAELEPEQAAKYTMAKVASK